MRNYPNDEYDFEDLERLSADNWMVEALKMNPDYNGWGNYEDYMSKDGRGWDSRAFVEVVDDLWELDDLNELVNFYFRLTRDSKDCDKCEGTGHNYETREIERSFYDFEETSKRWCNSITQDEADKLWEENRLKLEFDEKPSAEEVNNWNRHGFGHDAINRWILIEQRAKRLGVYGKCDDCDGKGYIFTEPKARLQIQMWFLHPRKGCSRGVLLQNINNKAELSKVVEYLKEARQRNWDRFSKLTY